MKINPTGLRIVQLACLLAGTYAAFLAVHLVVLNKTENRSSAVQQGMSLEEINKIVGFMRSERLSRDQINPIYLGRPQTEYYIPDDDKKTYVRYFSRLFGYDFYYFTTIIDADDGLILVIEDGM